MEKGPINHQSINSISSNDNLFKHFLAFQLAFQAVFINKSCFYLVCNIAKKLYYELAGNGEAIPHTIIQR